MLVVTHHQHTSLEVLDSLHQPVHGVQVQVIGRLIQNEDMRIVPHANRKSDSRFLASGQQIHFLGLHRASNTEHAQMATVDLLLQIGEQALQLLERGHEEVELVEMVLGKGGDSGSGTDVLLS